MHHLRDIISLILLDVLILIVFFEALTIELVSCAATIGLISGIVTVWKAIAL